MTHTTTNLETLIDAYLEIWNESVAAVRRETIDRVWAEDAYFVDPTQSSTGRDELNALIDGFHQTFPEHRCELVAGSQHGNIFRWGLVSPAGDTLVIGEDTIQVNEAGLIQSVTGTFVES